MQTFEATFREIQEILDRCEKEEEEETKSEEPSTKTSTEDLKGTAFLKSIALLRSYLFNLEPNWEKMETESATLQSGARSESLPRDWFIDFDYENIHFDKDNNCYTIPYRVTLEMRDKKPPSEKYKPFQPSQDIQCVVGRAADFSRVDTPSKPLYSGTVDKLGHCEDLGWPNPGSSEPDDWTWAGFVQAGTPIRLEARKEHDWNKERYEIIERAEAYERRCEDRYDEVNKYKTEPERKKAQEQVRLAWYNKCTEARTMLEETRKLEAQPNQLPKFVELTRKLVKLESSEDHLESPEVKDK